MRNDLKFSDLTHEIVKSFISYDQDNGSFRWKEREAVWFSSNSSKTQVALANNWNSKYANQTAFDSLHKEGYYYGRIFRIPILSHRLALFYVSGIWPKEVDHIDGNRKNNSIINLREVTRKENAKNSGINKNNTSGCVGVYQNPKGRWVAQMVVDNKNYYLGTYDDKEEAIIAASSARRVNGFTERHINGL